MVATELHLQPVRMDRQMYCSLTSGLPALPGAWPLHAITATLMSYF